MAINTNVVRVGVLDPSGQPARFTLSIFGIPTEKFYESPGGGNPILEALLEQRNYQRSVDAVSVDEGEDSLYTAGYSSSMFMVHEVHRDELCPPHIVLERSDLANDF